MKGRADDAVQHLLRRSIRPGEPGAIVCVYRGGDVEEVFAAGLSSLEYDQPITANTIFNIGSCSKQFTAACAVLLHQDGRLDLDTPLSDYLPALPIGRAMSIRQCLQHTAGLYDYLSVADIAGVPTAALTTEADFLRYLARQRSTQFQPGQSIAYSNTNYVTSALAMNRVTGSPFGRLVHDCIFTPLAMHNSCIRDRVGLVVPDMAFSYKPDGRGFLRVEMPEALPGDSNVLTSINDLAHWFGFLVDGRILGESVRAQLMTPARLAGGSEMSYALGLFTGSSGGTAYIGHSGSHYGYRAFTLCVPERDFAVAVLANRSDFAVRDIVAHLLTRHIGGLTSARDRRTAAQDANAAGNWYAPEINELLRVRADGSGLEVTDLGVASVVSPSGADRWTSWDGLQTLRLSGSRLVWTNRMGRQAAYQRLAEHQPLSAQLAGSYVNSEFGLRFEVEGPPASLAYRPAGCQPSTLAYAGRLGNQYVYHAGWNVLAFTVGGDGDISLAARCENASVAGFTRAGNQDSDRGV